MSNANVFNSPQDRFRVGLAELAGKWGWCLALGVFLIVLGLIASGMAVRTTLLSTLVLAGYCSSPVPVWRSSHF
jgi:uncharacterized membrane protein HdeD (DUF308 family)